MSRKTPDWIKPPVPRDNLLPREEAAALMRAAEAARQNAYTPYSHFQVGAALLTADGTVVPGCNVENAAFTPTNCAERTAVFAAVDAGCRDFAAIAIIGGREGEPGRFCAPCGVCRQVLCEFCPPEFPVVLGSVEAFDVYALGDLLPFAFTKDSL